MRPNRLVIVFALSVAAIAPGARAATSIDILLANVGNSNVFCAPYAFKLCFQEVEDRIAAGIQAKQPDIVALIEVLPTARCAAAYQGAPEPDPQKVCSPLQGHDDDQVRRLVGANYTITCDGRYGWDCVAVRNDSTAVGAITTAPPVPGCDDGFTVNALDVTASPVGAFRLVLAHPDSGFTSGSAGTACRVAQLDQAFAAATGPTVLLGDMNMDPYRGSGPDVDLWTSTVGEGKPFHYNSGIAERNPPLPTYFMGESSNLIDTGMMLPTVEDPSGTFQRSTLDHVTSTFLRGFCRTLGEAEYTTRLDGGPGGGMDHRGLACSLRP